MKKIGLLFLIILASLSAAYTQKKDRTDAFMYNKQGQYYQAMQSIEKCINHPDFYHMKTKDQAQAWLYRAAIYVNASALDNAASICPKALAIAKRSLESCINTDASVAQEYEHDIKVMVDYINSAASSINENNATNDYTQPSRPSQSHQTSNSNNPQYEFFSSIPKYKSILLGFSNDAALSVRSRHEDLGYRENFVKSTGNQIGMVIFDDYSVHMEYANVYTQGHPPTEFPISIIGDGVLLWQNQQMVLQLEVLIKTRGGCYASPNGYWYINYPNQNTTSSYKYDVFYDATSNQLIIDGKAIEVNTRAEVTNVNKYGTATQCNDLKYMEALTLSGRHRITMEAKTQSELNAQNSDMYGKWQWNDDRSEIFLESTTKDARLVLWNNDGNLSWGFLLSNTAATGYKTEALYGAQDLVYLMITFDGASEQSFSFLKTGNLFSYVQYDRFLGTLNNDASILSQIKDKRTLIVNYKQNGSDKTAMFQLEGLEAIYNAITQ